MIDDTFSINELHETNQLDSLAFTHVKSQCTMA